MPRLRVTQTSQQGMHLLLFFDTLNGTLSIYILTSFHACSFLANVLGFQQFQHEAREAVQLDYAIHVLE